MNSNPLVNQAEARFKKMKANWDAMWADVEREAAEIQMEKDKKEWRMKLEKNINDAEQTLHEMRGATEDKLQELQNKYQATMQKIEDEMNSD